MGKVKLTPGKTYIVTLHNGYKLEGELQDLRYEGAELYILWNCSDKPPVYVSFGETEDIKLK